MGQAPPAAGGGRILAQVPGPDRLDLRHVRLAFCAALPASFVPSRLSMPSDTTPLSGQQPQHLAEQPAQRLLVPRAEPGDGGMIGVQPAAITR
jgi:hypothetical protein